MCDSYQRGCSLSGESSGILGPDTEYQCSTDNDVGGNQHRRRSFDGREYLLVRGLTADFALIKGRVADRHGNVVYNKTARNFSPLMAMAGSTTIVQAASVVPAGELDPEVIVTQGIFVQRVVAVANPAHESALIAAGASYP